MIKLTTRERQVVDLLCQGYSTREVAAMLGVHPRAADTHRLRALKKVGVKNAVQLLRRAIQLGWAHVPPLGHPANPPPGRNADGA